MGRRGPKFKMEDDSIPVVEAMLTVGATMQDVADYFGVDYSTLYRWRERNKAKLASRLKQSEVKGKLYHLKKIYGASDWRSSAFILERKYWQEYSRHNERAALAKLMPGSAPPLNPNAPPDSELARQMDLVTAPGEPEPTEPNPAVDHTEPLNGDPQ